MSYHQGNAVTTSRRGSFIGWTQPKQYEDTQSYYERSRDSTRGQSDRRGSTKIAGGWEQVVSQGLSLPTSPLEKIGKTGWATTRGTYGAERSRPLRHQTEQSSTTSKENPASSSSSSSSSSNSPQPGSPDGEKQSITLNFGRSKTGTSLPRRVVSEGPRADKAQYVAPHAALEYQLSDLFGYYASHELDWSHIIRNQHVTHAGGNAALELLWEKEDNKLKNLLKRLELKHLEKVFLSRGISFVGVIKMTPEHFATLGVVGDEQKKILKSLRFIQHFRGRNKCREEGGKKEGEEAGEEEAGGEEEDKIFNVTDDNTEDGNNIVPLQRQHPRFMVSSRQWNDHYRGPYYGQNAVNFMGGRSKIRLGHGDSIANMFWGSTLRAKKNGHHHSTDFRKNFIRHEGVTLHSSHYELNPTSSPPPRVVTKNKFMKERFDKKGKVKMFYDTGRHDGRRATMHITKIDALWANVSGLDGNFRHSPTAQSPSSTPQTRQ